MKEYSDWYNRSKLTEDQQLDAGVAYSALRRLYDEGVFPAHFERPEEEIYYHPAFTLDRKRKKVIIKEKDLDLRPKEYEIILKLADKPNTVIPYFTIVADVWNTTLDESSRHTFQETLSSLKRKLLQEREPDSLGYELISTMPKVGIILNDPNLQENQST